jgi:Sulfotransferase domain
MPNTLRIAMWSGPRNLSTAMMRSFSSRPDTAVIDEPFYAHYLRETGIAHPGRERVIAAYENNWPKVIDLITGPVPGAKPVWYQKHMAHHMLPHIDVQRLVESPGLVHAFLIRDPAQVISSYTKVHAKMTIDETGLAYQADLFERVHKRTGRIPPVVDAKDVLLDPKRTLSRLCESLGIAFTDAMLTWPAGPHADDGNWAPYWYDSVYQSTGFDQYRDKPVTIAPQLAPMHAQARQLYDILYQHKL